MLTLRQTARAGAFLLAGLMVSGQAAPVQANGLSGAYLAARQAEVLGDFAEAARYYSRALVFDPKNPEFLERAVFANIALGAVERAAVIAETLVAVEDGNQIARLVLASQLAQTQNFEALATAIAAGRGMGGLADGLAGAWAELGRGDMSAALAGFDDVEANDPGLAAFARYHKALALATVGDFASAEALFSDNARDGLHRTRRGVIARAEVLSQLGRFDEAVALIDSGFGADLDPELETLRAAMVAGQPLPFDQIRGARDGVAEVLYSLAAALSNEGNDEVTLLYARLAAYLRPDHIDAVLLSADQLEDIGQFDLAVSAFAEVPVDNPAYHAAELGRAAALRRQGKIAEAIEVLDRLTTTHGDVPAVHSTLGDLLRGESRFGEAAEAYGRAIELTPEITARQWFLFYARGVAQERDGNWDLAEADFRRALELNPDQPNVLNYLGYSMVEKRINLDEALDMIERAAAARPDAGFIIDSLGWVLFRLGRYEEAVPHMEHAAELMRIDPVVNDHLGDVYWAVGRKREAQFQWRRALSFVDWEDRSEDVKPERIRRKLEIGLDKVLEEEGADPLHMPEVTDL